MKVVFKTLLLLISICIVGLVALNSFKDASSEKNTIEKVYYGAWRVDQIAGFPRVHADPEEAIKNRVGKKITISAEQYIDHVGTKNMSPVFKEEVIAEPRFQDGYKSSFKNLGITGDFIIRVTVYENNKVYGDFLYAPKEDKIITRYEGLFLNAFRE